MNSMQQFGSCQFWLITLVLTVGSLPTTSRAQSPGCDALSAEQQQLMQKLFAALHPYDVCDETFERCLAKKPPQPLVLRLASDVCRHIKASKSHDEIEHLLAKRAKSVLPMGKPASFALDDATLAGSPFSPVTVVVYACARCPFCRVFVPALQREVEQGALHGKVRLYFQLFPLRDHPGSTEGGLAMLSAARLGKFWPFVGLIYKRYDIFCPKLFGEWAAEVGLDRATFEQTMTDPAIRQTLIASKKEGIRNKVDATPMLFVEGRRYVYDLNLEVVVDVLLEVVERSESSRR